MNKHKRSVKIINICVLTCANDVSNYLMCIRTQRFRVSFYSGRVFLFIVQEATRNKSEKKKNWKGLLETNEEKIVLSMDTRIFCHYFSTVNIYKGLKEMKVLLNYSNDITLAWSGWRCWEVVRRLSIRTMDPVNRVQDSGCSFCFENGTKNTSC